MTQLTINKNILVYPDEKCLGQETWPVLTFEIIPSNEADKTVFSLSNTDLVFLKKYIEAFLERK